MNNKQLHKLLKPKKKSSGFTLIELLTGLIMSIFVTGALGFGLYQILKTTGKESSKISARNEATRAIEFISDEIRRASTVDNDLRADLNDDGTEENTAGNFPSATGKTVVLALEIPELNSSQQVDRDGASGSPAGMLGSDADATTPERIVYYLRSSTGTNWQGPLVLYRWGPPLNANGEYTQNTWTEEALIDGIDNEVISNACASVGGTQAPAIPETAKGFYACIEDDDRDGITENGLADANGDGTIDARDNHDADGRGKAAQLFLTGGVFADKSEANSNNPSETYTADTKVAARAKLANVNSSEADEVPGTDFQTLKADYDCRYIEDSASGTRGTLYVGVPWTLRLDFNKNDLSGINLDDTDPNTNYDSDQLGKYNDTTRWIHRPNRKPQPINISTDNDLTITASAVGKSGCSSRGNLGTNGTEDLSEYDASKDVNYILKLNNASGNDGDGNPNWHSFNGYDKKNDDGTDRSPAYDDPDVNGDGSVLVLKPGSVITKELNPAGFDFDGSGTAASGQESLGDYLVSEGYATYNSGTESYTITDKLRTDQRILALELGHTEKYLNGDTNTPNPGFDVNDAIFIMTNEKFDDEY